MIKIKQVILETIGSRTEIPQTESIEPRAHGLLSHGNLETHILGNFTYKSYIVYIGETGRRLGERFREHFRDVEKDDENASKPVARHLNLLNHSKQLRPLPTSRKHGKPQNSRRKI